MKVAFDGRAIADRFPGIGRYSFELARSLGGLVELALIADAGAANTRHRLADISGQRLEVRGRPGSLAAQWRVPRAVAGTGAAIYHSPHYLVPYGVGLAARSARPVVTLYDLIPLMPEAHYRPAARLVIRMAHLAAASVAHRIVVLSRWAKDSLARALRLRPDRLHVIPPGVSDAFCPRPAAEVAALRSRHDLPDQYLLYVGTRRPHKNLERLAEAHRRLPRSAPSLVVAGPLGSRFPLAQSAVEQSGAAGRIRFTGEIPEAELPALYSGAALFVCPSLAEGFGLPVVEAMACGAPVACSTAPGLDEAAGQAAARFDPYDVDDMAATLGQILDDQERRAEMRSNSLAHAASFTWRRAAQMTVDLYRAAVGVSG